MSEINNFKKPTNKPTRRVGISIILVGLGIITGLVIGNYSSTFVDRVSRKTVSSNSALPDDLDYSTVEEVYDTLKKNYDGELKVSDLMNGLKHGLAEATNDPYTTYLSTEENEAFDSSISGTFTGIGAELSKENDLVIISTPLSGFPAEKAGIRAKDIILKIDNQDATTLTVAEAVKKIRGDKGTTVKLTLLRGEKQLEISIVRDVITIPSVTSEVTDNIAYLKINRFGQDTYDLALKFSKEYKDKNVKGVIVDVRNNPGGYLDQAVKVASLWLPQGTKVVEEKRGNASLRVDKSIGNNVLTGTKTIILINGGSASASEILAGALSDNKAATLVGEKSYGKGSVQQVEDFDGGSALKVTIARWFTPAGKNIDKEGIMPEKEVKVTEKDVESKIDVQKNAAIELINN